MSFVRNVVGAVFPLFTQQMYEKLGIQGATGLVSVSRLIPTAFPFCFPRLTARLYTSQGLGTLLAGTPFLIFIHGARLRARSPFAKELAQKQAEERAKREAGDRSRDTSLTRAGDSVEQEKEKDLA